MIHLLIKDLQPGMVAAQSIYDRNGYNGENSTFSTIDQNLRSHPSYLGTVSSRRFEWEETVEVPDSNNTMVKKIVPKMTSTSAVILDYAVFVQMYNIDFRRSAESTMTQENGEEGQSEGEPGEPEDPQQTIPFEETDKAKANVPF